MKAFADTFARTGYSHPKKIWGKIIENRGTQITFSALGQKAPVAAKEKWHANHEVRPQLMKIMKKMLPKFEVRSGGLTSIDVTQKGIDKAYGVRQIKKVLNIPIRDMVFIGDALHPGGNDYAARKTGIECIMTSGPDETRKIIEKIIKAG
jgi:HAD superfamily hydrolase (TIGR01484 family)